MANKPYSIGISLSGGGARGIAHIGVLKALAELGIEPEVISGSSAGSIVGALYAAGLNWEEILDFVRSASLIRVLKPGMSTKGLISLSALKDHLAKYISEDSFEGLQKPLYIAISNLQTGQAEIRSSGPLFEIITASSAIPLVFNPVEINGQVYVDGGLLLNLPVEPLLSQADHVIGVNIMPQIELSRDKIKGVLSMATIATRCFHLSVINNTRPWLDACAIVIEPTDLHKYHIFQFNKVDDLVRIGYEAAIAQSESLKRLISS
jgi:NTE family protein